MNREKRFFVVHTNDLHSHLTQMAKVTSFVAKRRKEWYTSGFGSILIDVGDHLDRFHWITEGTDGLVNRAILELAGYDLVTLGNNELLTFSKEQLRKIYEQASFQVISSNVVEKESGQPPDWLKPWYIYKWQGKTFGFLALTIPYPLVYEELGWIVRDPFTVLSELVPRLRPQVDVLILLSHLGYSSDKEIATKIKGIDLILGGHTHHLLKKAVKIKDTYLAAAGKYGEAIGEIEIRFSSHSNRWQMAQAVCHDGTDEPPHPETLALIRQYEEQAKENLSKPVARITEDLEIDYNQESKLGNLLADSLARWTGAKIAIVNSGQLLDGLKKGMITRLDLHSICPHPINPVLVEMTGEQIRLSLEESLLPEYQTREIRGYGFRGKVLGNLCVSGLKIHYDPREPAYQKIKCIEYEGKNLQDEQTYPVATIDMFLFGSAYSQFQKSRLITYHLPEFLRDVLAFGLEKDEILQTCHQRRWLICPKELSMRRNLR